MSLNDLNNRQSSDPKYGAWKFVEEITFADLDAYPIWVWCMEIDRDGGPEVGSEATLRPLLNTLEVPFDLISPPLILLKIQGTDLYASELLDVKRKKLEAIWIFDGNNVLHPDEINNLSKPVIYLSVPAINGCSDVAFEQSTLISDEAYMSSCVS